jgi:tetratricopeptide (TPR) repeat protein
MKCGRLFVLLLAVASSYVCFAQRGRPAPDPTQLAVTQAIREGRITDAEKLLTDAIRALQQNDPQSPRLASYLKELSGFVDRRGGRSEAMALLQRAYEIDLHAYGPADMNLTNDLVNLASHAQVAGDNREAEQRLNQALDIVRSNTSNLKSRLNVDLAAGVFGSLTNLYITEKRWVDAERMMQEESKLCELFEEPYRAGYALCGSLPGRLAEVYRAEGRTGDAEQVPQDTGGPPELAGLNKTAEKYEVDGLYPSAEETYNRAIALAEKIEADPQNRYGGLIVREMNSLGRLFEKEGFNDRAERSYANALEVDERLAGPQGGHTHYAEALNARYLVELYRREGRLKDAESLLQRVREIQEKSLGERHRAVVQTIMMLAGIYEEEGKKDQSAYAQALPLYEHTVAIQELNLGPDHPDLLWPLGKYADLLQILHDDAKAAAVRTRMAVISTAQQKERK